MVNAKVNHFKNRETWIVERLKYFNDFDDFDAEITTSFEVWKVFFSLLMYGRKAANSIFFQLVFTWESHKKYASSNEMSRLQILHVKIWVNVWFLLNTTFVYASFSKVIQKWRVKSGQLGPVMNWNTVYHQPMLIIKISPWRTVFIACWAYMNDASIFGTAYN